jgi:hypothetical protein
MLRVFQKYRKKFWAGKGVQKYILYAVGEIFLVVIGILIALQVNNWNEVRKARTFEITMLEEIQEALNKDIRNLKMTSDYLKSVLYSVQELTRIQNNRNHRTDSLKFHLEMLRTSGVAVNINKSPYEALKSSGMDRISNPELRKSLLNLYGNAVPSFEGWVNEIVRISLFDRDTLFNTLFPPYAVAENERISNKYKITNMDLIYKDSRFDELLLLGGGYIHRVLLFLDRTVENLEAVHAQITKELSR